MRPSGAFLSPRISRLQDRPPVTMSGSFLWGRALLPACGLRRFTKPGRALGFGAFKTLRPRRDALSVRRFPRPSDGRERGDLRHRRVRNAELGRGDEARGLRQIPSGPGEPSRDTALHAPAQSTPEGPTACRSWGPPGRGGCAWAGPWGRSRVRGDSPARSRGRQDRVSTLALTRRGGPGGGGLRQRCLYVDDSVLILAGELVSSFLFHQFLS